MESKQLQRLEFLARLPVLLNSSLTSKHVITVAIKQMVEILEAETATVFLRSGSTKELVFWSLEGAAGERLKGTKISADVGIVGWVTTHGKSALVADTSKDHRFFSELDKQVGFNTRSIICAPLITSRERTIGAIEALNKRNGEPFSEEDLAFLEHFAVQVALAVDNAQLFEQATTRAHQLATLDRRKQDMLTVIAHEVRTPLNVIQNAAELLALPDNPDQDRDALVEVLQRGVGRLTSLISRIKNVAAVTDERLELNRTAVDAQSILDAVAAQHQEIAAGRKLHLTVELLPDPVVVEADNTLLAVVLRNLLANAIRFTPDGGSIILRAKPHAGLVEFAVCDSGIGIASNEIPLIFEKFYEVNSSLAHSSGVYEFGSAGLGLGLSAVKAILDAHGVAIDVESTPGVGSTFRFCLPLASDGRPA